eukprot:gene10960-3668_t
MSNLLKIIPAFTIGVGLGGFFVDQYKREPKKQISKVLTFKEQLEEKYGLPGDENLKEYENFVSSRNYQKKIPNWVFLSVSKDDFELKDEEEVSDRKFSHFNNKTQEIPEIFRANNTDYFHSGYSRGHMIAASDMKYKSQNSMNETFLLNSNIVPQEFNNNGNFWYRLEVFVRKNLIKNFKRVNVISGPAFLPNVEENEKKYVKYQILGENQVAVPNYLFKSILVETEDGKNFLGNFLIPNEPIPKNKSLLDYESTKENLEKSTGLVFFDKIAVDGNLCENFDCLSMMTDHQLEKWNFSRRISWSKTKEEADSIWDEIKQKGYEPDEYAIVEYQKKVKEFKEKMEND